MNQLRDMSVFAHIVEQGSITAAADFLQLSKSVVSQSLRSLEEELGVALLKRTTRRQTLTVAGKAFFEHCRALNSIADKAWQQAKDTLEVPQGGIRITAPNALMGVLIAPAIARVMERYPKLEPELVGSDQHLDIVADDIDLAIRVGASESSSLKQRRIGEFRDVLCGCSNLVARSVGEYPAYIANAWQSRVIHHTFLHRDSGDSFDFSATVRCKADSFHSCLALIREGVGIGLMPDFLFEKMEPSLSLLFPDHELPVNSVYALHPYTNGLPMSVMVCLESIESELSKAI